MWYAILKLSHRYTFLVSSYFSLLFLFSYATRSILKVNILHNISPNLGRNMIQLKKIYTKSNWCSSQWSKLWGTFAEMEKYTIDFIGRKYSMLTNICNIYHICNGQYLVLVGSKFHVIYQKFGPAVHSLSDLIAARTSSMYYMASRLTLSAQ